MIEDHDRGTHGNLINLTLFEYMIEENISLKTYII